VVGVGVVVEVVVGVGVVVEVVGLVLGGAVAWQMLMVTDELVWAEEPPVGDWLTTFPLDAGSQLVTLFAVTLVKPCPCSVDCAVL